MLQTTSSYEISLLIFIFHVPSRAAHDRPKNPENGRQHNLHRGIGKVPQTEEDAGRYGLARAEEGHAGGGVTTRVKFGKDLPKNFKRFLRLFSQERKVPKKVSTKVPARRGCG